VDGYKIPASAKDQELAKNDAGVTCEACHGPGGKYTAIHEDIEKNKRQYKVQELYHAGKYRVSVRVCTPCHNKKNPTTDAAYHFDYEKSKDEDTHENYKLKYRAK